MAILSKASMPVKQNVLHWTELNEIELLFHKVLEGGFRGKIPEPRIFDSELLHRVLISDSSTPPWGVLLSVLCAFWWSAILTHSMSVAGHHISYLKLHLCLLSQSKYMLIKPGKSRQITLHSTPKKKDVWLMKINATRQLWNQHQTTKWLC